MKGLFVGLSLCSLFLSTAPLSSQCKSNPEGYAWPQGTQVNFVFDSNIDSTTRSSYGQAVTQWNTENQTTTQM
jgi:hypothetical protein